MHKDHRIVRSEQDSPYQAWGYTKPNHHYLHLNSTQHLTHRSQYRAPFSSSASRPKAQHHTSDCIQKEPRDEIHSTQLNQQITYSLNYKSTKAYHHHFHGSIYSKKSIAKIKRIRALPKSLGAEITNQSEIEICRRPTVNSKPKAFLLKSMNTAKGQHSRSRTLNQNDMESFVDQTYTPSTTGRRLLDKRSQSNHSNIRHQGPFNECINKQLAKLERGRTSHLNTFSSRAAMGNLCCRNSSRQCMSANTKPRLKPYLNAIDKASCKPCGHG